MEDRGQSPAPCMDPTELRERLAESERRYEELIRGSSDLLLTCDRSGRIVSLNPAGSAITGFAVSDIAGWSVARFLGHPWTPENAQCLPPAIELRRKDGGRAWLEVSVQTMLDRGEPHGYLLRGHDVTARKFAELAELAATNAADCIFCADASGRLLYVNDAACKLYGKGKDELLRLRIPDFAPAVAGEAAWAVGWAAVKSGLSVMRSYFRSPDGRMVPVQISAKVVRCGSTEYMAGSVRDISRRGADAAALRTSEDRFRSLFETMGQGVLYLDRSGKILSANPAAAKIFGVPLDKFLGKTQETNGIRAVDEAGRLLAAGDCPAMEALRTGVPVRNRLIGVLGPDGGECRWVLIDAVPQYAPGDGVPSQVYTILSDVTESRKAEAALKKSEREFRALFENVPVGVAQTGMDGSLLRANPAMLELLGLSAGTDPGSVDITQFYRTAGVRQALRERLLSDGVVRGMELDLNRGSGEHATLLCNAHLVRDDKGNPAHFEAIFVDISERKRAQDLVLQIAQGLVKETGVEFFDSLIAHLARALGSDCAFVGETLPGGKRNRFLASVGKGCAPAGFEYDLEGTPCFNVVGKTLYICPSGVRGKFSSPITQQSGMEAYAGIPLTDSKGSPLGNIGVMFVRPLEDTGLVQSTLGIFAARASAELERIKSEHEARRSDQRLRAFMAGSTEGVWCFEFDRPIMADMPRSRLAEVIYEHGHIAECNDAYAKMRGFESADQMRGLPVRAVIPQTDWDDLIQALPTEPWQNSFISQQVDANGGERCFVRSITPIVSEGKIEQLWGLMVDITDRRKAEMALRESERRFREMLENMQLVAVILDCDGRIAFCNEFLLRLTGWTAEEVIGQNWFEVFIPEANREELRGIFGGLITNLGKEGHRENTILTRAGASRLIYWDNTVLRSPEGTVTGCACLGRDVTEQHALEERYRQSQKLESVGRLAGGIAHDFNNLLTVINGYSDFLLQQVSELDPLRPSLIDIRGAGEKAATLTHQLLAFSRRQVLKPVVLDLNACITDAGKMLRRVIGEDVKLETELEPDLCKIRADAGQINQILMNLAVNARDAMPFGGTLTIESANAEVGEGTQPDVTGLPSGKYAMLTVADTGVGMAPEVKSHLFEPFFTTKEAGRGTGLGLSTVYGIVEQSGGRITVESEPGSGTRFHVYLPKAIEEAAAPKSAAAPELCRGTETILLVEDQLEVRKLVASLLRSMGYRVLEAEDGADAMHAARDYENAIDLLLADLVMPGMGGTELAERLAKARPNMRVMYMSGYADRQSPSLMAADMPEDTIRKPFSSATLGTRVREILDRGKGGKAAGG